MPRVPFNLGAVIRRARANEVTWALGRQPGRIYASKTFPFPLPNSQDYRQPTRYIWKVFDEAAEPEDLDSLPDIECTEYVVTTTPGGRKQIKIQVTRQAGNIRRIEIQKVPTEPDTTEVQTILTLDREASSRLILLARTLDNIPVDGGEETIRVEDQLLREIFSDPEAIARIYNRVPDQFRQLVEDDPSATDVIALAHRREIVEHFRKLLTEPDFFEQERAKAPGGKREAVWQLFLEQNPWILGIGLAGQLLTSWDNTKLEQTVAGFSVAGPGKRTDALLRTSGSIRSLVFAEIKHHLTDLLCAKEYRSGCWAPSEDLAGGVTQVQQTLELARREIGEALREKAPDGSYTGEETYLLRPRSFLILGTLDQLRGTGGGVHSAQFSSFELYRRNLYEPEILTFDELLARAEWHVALAECERT
jgi:Shedu protein SduA, C-terminal